MAFTYSPELSSNIASRNISCNMLRFLKIRQQQQPLLLPVWKGDDSQCTHGAKILVKTVVAIHKIQKVCRSK